MGLALVLSFFVAPEDADQGISQRIFYIHVPIALTAYFCFGLGAWKALLLLWRGDERYDLESYVAIHQGTIFGSLTLITGAIWAKASWGVWWTWDSNQLVLFLTLFLFYCAYFMLRFSLPEGPRRARLVGRVRLVRGRADPDQLPRDPARGGLHPPDDVHARGPADDRHDVHGVLRLVGGRDAPGLRPVPGRARGQAAATRIFGSCARPWSERRGVRRCSPTRSCSSSCSCTSRSSRRSSFACSARRRSFWSSLAAAETQGARLTRRCSLCCARAESRASGSTEACCSSEGRCRCRCRPRSSAFARADRSAASQIARAAASRHADAALAPACR